MLFSTTEAGASASRFDLVKGVGFMCDLTEALLALGEFDCAGTTYQETEIRNGVSYTRTIKPIEALGIAALLLKAPSNRELLEEGKRLIRLSEWHRTGMDGELTEDG